MSEAPSSSKRFALGLIGALALAVVLWLLLRGDGPTPEPDSAGPVVARVTPIAVQRTERKRSTTPVAVPASANQSEEVSAEEPEVAAVPLVRRYVVLDVWNSEPVGGLEFEWRGEVNGALLAALGLEARAGDDRDDGQRGGGDSDSEDGSAEQKDAPCILTCSVDGLLTAPVESTERNLRPVLPDWRVVTCEAEGATSGEGVGTIWVYRLLRVSGRVTVASTEVPLVIESVRIEARSHGEDRLLKRDPAAPPRRSEAWLTRHRLARLGTVGTVDARGQFAFEIPRLPSTTLRAVVPPPAGKQGSGWRDAAHAITDRQAASGSVQVAFVLERGYEITGRLTDEDGRPIAGALVTLHVVRYVDKDGMIPSKLRAPGHGYTARWNPTMPKAVIDYMIHAYTDANGNYVLLSKVEGVVTLSFVPQTEHRVANVALGPIAGMRPSAEFQVRSAKGTPGVKLTGRLGASFAGLRVSFSDLSYGDIQPSYSYVLGDDSVLPSRFLVRGRRYAFSVYPKSGALPIADEILTWDGSAEIEIGPLRLGGRQVENGTGKTR